MEDPKDSLGKHIKKRVLWWVLAGYAMIWTIYNVTPAFPIVLTIFLLVDEKLKEGYWVKCSDFKKRFTHEWFLAIGVSLATIYTLLKDVFRRDERGKKQDD